MFVSGFARALARSCPMLPMLEVMGLMGVPSLCILGSPYIYGSEGCSGMRCIMRFPCWVLSRVCLTERVKSVVCCWA